MSHHSRMASSSNAMRRSSSSTSANVPNYQQSRVAPNSSAVRRNSSSASTAAPNHQAGSNMQRRPNTIPLNRDRISKIPAKLKAFRAEHEQLQLLSGLDAQGSNNIIAQAMEKRVPKNNRGPPSISAQSEQSFVTDMTVDTERTSVTIIFDRNTGQETQEKVKKQLDPVLKSRKDLLRAIGTCRECRNKKVKCFLSHHALEDLLDMFPEAADDVRWGLETDTDPKHSERNFASHNRRSPTEHGSLGFLMEEDPYEAGTQRRVVGFGKVDEMFDLSDMAQPTAYDPNLVVESMSDVRSSDNDFLAAANQVYGNGYVTQTQFQPSPASHELFGTGSQAQSFMGTSTFESPSGQEGFSMRQSASSINNRSNPRISLMPSVSYQGTFLAPQLASSERQQYTYSQPSSLAGGTHGPFQSIDQTTNALLASFNGQFFKCLMSCNMTESSLCGRELTSLQQMIVHIQQSHADHRIGIPSPLRSVCPSCYNFYAQTERMCIGCRQQTEHFICGTSPSYGSQLSSPSVQSLGGDGMDFDSMSYEFLSAESDAWSNGNGVASPMSDGRSNSNSGFGSGFVGNFGSNNDSFDGGMNGYR